MTEVLAPTTLGRPVPTKERIIEADGVSVRFPVGRTGFWGQQTKWVHAVDDVSFTVHHGETLGLVGESGSGKTTVGRMVLRRIAPSAGRIIFHGEDVTQSSGEELRKLRRRMQLVFQDPYASLNPRMSVLQLVAEPLVVHGLVKSARAARDQVVALLERCGLPEDTADRHPHAFSGGQRQRIGIARALALQPDFIVADEPVSALDVSVRAQIVNLLQDLQREFGIAYLFIAHDLSVVRHISHRIAILYAGKLVELADSDAVYESPLHPYTEALLSSVPIPDPPIQRARQRIVLQGEIPNPIEPPPGCRFQTRCPLVQDVCRSETPRRSRRRHPATGLPASYADARAMTQINTTTVGAAERPTAGLAPIAVVGLLAGFLAGLFGVGGGILIVPGLVLGAHMTQRLAHGTSLAAVVPISVASLVTYAAHDNVDWSVAAWLAVGAVAGALIGTHLLHVLPHRTLAIIFIVVLVASALRLFLATDADGRGDLTPASVVALVVVGLVTGILAGLLGVGGGIVMVPAMILLFDIAPVIAKGTSAAVIIAAAVMGTWRNRANDNTDLRAAAVIGVAGIATAAIGGVLADRMSDDLSNVLFASLLLIVAARLAWGLRHDPADTPE